MALQVASTSSFGSGSKSNTYRYDVFLSFRGEDTRHNFTVLLYDALRRKGINAFIDDKKLGKGKRIAPTLLKAIERSRISIIVFSENYATSTWCLDELAHIIRCNKEKNQVVMPIFYKVDPVDVQYQRNSYEEAMAAHEERFRNDADKVRNSSKEAVAANNEDLEKLQKWRSALFEAASLSSAWRLEDGYDEGAFIESIVDEAHGRLPPKRFHNVDYIVGLEPRIGEVMSLLDEIDNSVCMLGIHGTGGIGKTTLAKAVYNLISYNFEGACFLFDVKEASKKYQGVVRLQQELLSEILEEKIMMFGSADEGISRMKHRLSHKKVLLVLDDVDEVEQLEQLAGGCDWFGRGSKIIITTRDKQLLIAHDVEKKYEMMGLDEHDSLELFCCHAFHMSQPRKDYEDMCSCAISYAQGLPLALRVIGSNLEGNSSEEWRSILEQYERIPDRTIHDVLKISYDYLQDGAKRIFLDIACFIVEKEVFKSIRETVEAFDSGASFYLEVLVDKSLINLVHDWFFMHDLIRQMGREIVKQKAPLTLGNRSRLWYYKDVLTVLRENLVCRSNIEGIMLNPPQQEIVEWSGMAFEKMNNLRILVIRNVQFSTGPTYLPDSLRWLEWEGYPSTTLPTDFSPSELVFLKLPRSSFTLKEPPFKVLTNNYVTHLDFSYCEFIAEVPDMSQLQSLQRLDFAFCHNITKVHDSVGSLPKLLRLTLTGCPKLSIFPREINMPSLQFLILINCSSFDYFPHVVGNMNSLMNISLEGTAITKLPHSIGTLCWGLQTLSLSSCKSLRQLPNNLFTLPSLWLLDLEGVQPRTRESLKLMQDMQPVFNYYMKTLNLTNSGLLDEELVLVLSCFRNLQHLYLSRNDFVSLPKCIKECAYLERLEVNDCKRLRHIPELPPKLDYIDAENCTSLTVESFNNLYSQVKQELPRLRELRIRMPTGTMFPDWFDRRREGDTLSFHARRFLPAAALAFESSRANMFRVSISINGRKLIPDDAAHFYLMNCRAHHVLLVDLLKLLALRRDIHDEEEGPRLEGNKFEGMDWNDVEIQVVSANGDSCIDKCGIYVYRNLANMKDVHFNESPLPSTTSLRQRVSEQFNKVLRKFKTT